jgi:elongation factor 1 alpha-like protein
LRRRSDGLILILYPAGKKTPATPKTPKKSQKNEETSKDGALAGGVANLKVTDSPPPKSKGIDVIKEFEQSASKKHASFVVVGMIAHSPRI